MRLAVALGLAVALLGAAAAPAQEPPTPLDPVEVEGRRSVLDSDRARLEKLVPCIGDCEAVPVAEQKSLLRQLLGVLDVPLLFAEPDAAAPLKAPIKARLDDKLP